MANFPTSATTFPSRSNGQTIDASHVQTLQDEVAAIEDGYLSGSARLNSSNSTVATLSVTGGSTFAGAVTFGNGVASTVSFASSVTFAGNVTVSGALNLPSTGYLLGGRPSVLVAADSTANLANQTWTGLNWNVQKWVNPNMHSTSVNSSRITFAESTGLYDVTASIPFSTIASGFFLGRIVVNDSSAAASAHVEGNSNFQMAMTVSAKVRAASTTDYVTVQVFSGNSTGSIAAESTLHARVFGVSFVSK